MPRTRSVALAVSLLLFIPACRSTNDSSGLKEGLGGASSCDQETVALQGNHGAVVVWKSADALYFMPELDVVKNDAVYTQFLTIAKEHDLWPGNITQIISMFDFRIHAKEDSLKSTTTFLAEKYPDQKVISIFSSGNAVELTVTVREKLTKLAKVMPVTENRYALVSEPTLGPALIETLILGTGLVLDAAAAPSACKDAKAHTVKLTLKSSDFKYMVPELHSTNKNGKFMFHGKKEVYAFDASLAPWSTEKLDAIRSLGDAGYQKPFAKHFSK